MQDHEWKKSWLPVLVTVLLAGACSGQTAKKITGFADKVCACQDAACAEAVQAEYLDWWGKNQRARGSEGDRKTVEKAMERYATCHAKLVGPESAPLPAPVPKVDLSPPKAVLPPVKTVVPAGQPPVPAAGQPPVPAATAADKIPVAKPPGGEAQGTGPN